MAALRWIADGRGVYAWTGDSALEREAMDAKGFLLDEEETVSQPWDTEAQKQREAERLLAVARFGISVNTMTWTPERVVEEALGAARVVNEEEPVGQRHGYEGSVKPIWSGGWHTPLPSQEPISSGVRAREWSGQTFTTADPVAQPRLRDVRGAILDLEAETQRASNQLADLFQRLSPVTDASTVGADRAPTEARRTGLGAELSALAERVADIADGIETLNMQVEL